MRVLNQGSLIALALLGLLALIWSAPSSTAAPAASATPANVRWTVQALHRPLPRESGPPAALDAPPLTGLPAVFRPLIVPNFGPNVRANTDPSTTLAQQEPSIAVNPTNPLNVVAAAKDERAGVNTKQDWIYTSTDGGITWINQEFPLRAPLPPFSSDPVVKFSDDGICYITALPYGGGTQGIQVARSTDGGITFASGTQVTPNGNADKEWTWVDNFPSSPYYHRVYVAWMDFTTGSVIRLNYSTDQGQTWSPQKTVNTNTALQFPQPVVLPDGTVMVTYLSAAQGGSVADEKSTDGGNTFSPEQAIYHETDPNCPPDNSNCHIWRLSPLPATAISPLTGHAVIMTAEGISGTATVRFTRGTAGGTIWSPPAVVAPPPGTTVYQVEPWVEADELGVFHAVWYDDRDQPNTSIFDIYYSQSTDDGLTWTAPARISTASTDLRIGVPASYAQAAGDYINVTASHGKVYAAWTDTRSGTGEDIYTVRGDILGATPTPTATVAPSATATPQPTATATVQATATTTALPPTSTATATVPPIGTPPVTASPTPLPVTAVPSATATATVAATATACPIRFADVPPGSPFYSYVYCLACHGIISGYADNTFRPFAGVTRAQFAKFVANAAGFAETIPPGQQTFRDVPPSDPFWVFIERDALHGVVGGYADGTYRPANAVTRGEAAKLVANAANFTDAIPAGRQSFTDVPGSDPFWVYIERVALHGVISGYADGTFRPALAVTRGQTAKFAANAFFPGCAPR